MSIDIHGFVRQWREGCIDRRTFHRVLGSLGLAAVTFPVARPAAAGGTPLYFTWTGYEVPELHKPYVDKHGGSPDVSLFGDEEEALTKMRSGFPVDIAHPCVEVMQKWYDAGILLPIDVSRLPHWEDEFTELKETKGVSFDGRVMIIPTDWGNSSVLYRTDLYEGEETWGMLFDEKLAGRISPWNSASNVYAAALVLGLDMFNVSEEDLRSKVADLLRKQRELTRFYWDDPVQAEQGMAAGEIIAMYAWNASLVNLKKQGVPVAYANPKEGIWTWACGLARINTGSGDENLVYDFIDAWMAPETGKFLIEAYGYGHGNRKSFELVDPARLDELGLSDPASLFANGHFFQPLDPETDTRYNKLWEEIVAGS